MDLSSRLRSIVKSARRPEPLDGAERAPRELTYEPDGPDVGLLKLLRRIADMLAAAVQWLARKAGTAVDALLKL